jgi:predicted enzyme related to lactoylglutathione lyase
MPRKETNTMKRVTGIGGVFFKSQDPEKLYGWYETHLGIKRQPYVGHIFEWKEPETGAEGQTVWALFPQNSKKFDSSAASFMLNYRVDDMDALLKALQQEGVAVEGREDGEYGKFAWVMDPEGNRIELWEPPQS